MIRTKSILNIHNYRLFFFMASAKSSCTTSTLSSVETELINRVHSHFPNNQPDKFYFFYATASPFSNFHPCHFIEDGVEFDTSEKYMMYHKASKNNFKFYFCSFYLILLFYLKCYLGIVLRLRPFFELQPQQNVNL